MGRCHRPLGRLDSPCPEAWTRVHAHSDGRMRVDSRPRHCCLLCEIGRFAMESSR